MLARTWDVPVEQIVVPTPPDALCMFYSILSWHLVIMTNGCRTGRQSAFKAMLQWKEHKEQGHRG